MKVLLVKMSSLGDVFHALPAVQDAYQQVPNLEIHWLVEEAFADIPSWHLGAAGVKISQVPLCALK